MDDVETTRALRIGEEGPPEIWEPVTEPIPEVIPMPEPAPVPAPDGRQAA